MSDLHCHWKFSRCQPCGCCDQRITKRAQCVSSKRFQFHSNSAQLKIAFLNQSSFSAIDDIICDFLFLWHTVASKEIQGTKSSSSSSLYWILCKSVTWLQCSCGSTTNELFTRHVCDFWNGDTFDFDQKASDLYGRLWIRPVNMIRKVNRMKTRSMFIEYFERAGALHGRSILMIRESSGQARFCIKSCW